MMSKILVLGCGLMGPAVSKDCAKSDEVTRVVGCDIDPERLMRCSEFVGSPKFRAVKLDITDHKALVERMRGFDVAINASAARFSMGVVEAAMEARTNVVDLAGGRYPQEGELYNRVEEAGITVIPGCGVDPGLIDILSGHGMDMMDDVEEVHFACGGLPRDPEPPFDYKIVFGGKAMPIRPGKVPMILDGELVEVDRYDALEPVRFEGLKEMEAFYDGYPSSLLRLCLERGVRTFTGKTIRYAGFVKKLMFLLDCGVIDKEPIAFQGKEIVPLEFFNALIYPKVRFGEGDRDITVLKVQVKGRKGDAEFAVSYDMVDYYDEERGITSMAKTTAYTAAIVARMLARGAIQEKGIRWPVRIIKGEFFDELLSSLRERGVHVRETVTAWSSL